MSRYTLQFYNFVNEESNIYINRWPDECPVCGHGINPRFVKAFGKERQYSDELLIEAIFRCPRVDCQAVFVASYKTDPYPRAMSDFATLQNGYISPYFKEEPVDEEIKKISPKFVEVYTQAKVADDTGLNLICGAGYRKALEIVLKDFLIKTEQATAEEVKGRMLGWLIVNKITNPKIKAVANLAKDVGNDETHYEKRLENLSLEDLRKLVKLTLFHIGQELLTIEYTKPPKNEGEVVE